MIKEVNGDIFKSNTQAIVNTVNCFGVMGKGIALEFKKRYPSNFNEYKSWCDTGMAKIGELLITYTQPSFFSKRCMIINFPTKFHWKNPSEYKYIKMGLDKLRYEIQLKGIKSIAIPALGCSNGGLEWVKVKELIYNSLGDLECNIQIYKPKNN